MNINSPLIAQLELTSKCNLRCIHCYRLDPHFSGFEDVKSNEKIVLLLAEKIVNAKLFDVVLTGGEPLVKKSLVKNLIKYFKDNNMHVSLNTNLLLLDDDLLRSLIDLKLNGLLISCPSSNPSLYTQMTGNGNYFRFEKNLKMVIESKLHFSVNMVVNKLNLHSIRETATHLKSLGVDRFGATPMGLNVEHPEFDLFLDKMEVGKLITDLLWVKEQLQMSVDIFEAIPKCIFPLEIHQEELGFLKRKCQAGRTAIAIANNGDVRPCAHNPDVYGNLFKHSLRFIWNKMVDWRTNVLIPERCKKCKVLQKCFGGCRTTAKAFSGRWNCEDPWMKFPLSIDTFKNKHFNNRFPSLNLTDLIFPHSIRWRKDKMGYLICTKTIRDIMLVNEELFRFVFKLQAIQQIKLGDLAEMCRVSFYDVSFQQIIMFLIKRKIISLKKGGECYVNI